MKPRVVITPPFIKPEGEVARRLQAAGIETIFHHWHGGRTEDEMISLLRGIDGVIAFGGDPLGPRVLESVDRLKVVARAGVGFDGVDVASATARGIAVCNAPGANRHAVAEMAFALMLQCARKLGENLAQIPNGTWTKHEGMDLAGSTLGIIGLGAIGKEVAQRARAFEMRVLAHDIIQDMQFAEGHGVSYVSLDELLRESDFVSVHVLLNAGTRHLINAERLAKMKPTAYLINTARGGVVDTEALYQALREKSIAGAGLDVHEREPVGESPLIGLDDVYLTPHVGGATATARGNGGIAAAENVIRILKGERPLSIINPEVLKD